MIVVPPRQADAHAQALERLRAGLEARSASYRELLGRLSTPQRQAYQRGAAPPVAPQAVAEVTPPAAGARAGSQGRVATAIRFALAQVGKRYVYGAAGPDAFDCSGLTMRAYAAAGIALPHSAEGQYGFGHHVRLDQLQPGDLIFFYSPHIEHVTMYLGDGLMITASTEELPIAVVPVASMASIAIGATRLVG